MDFFETPEEVAAQLEAARTKLKAFEDISDSRLLLARLSAAHRFHPAVLARTTFFGLAGLGLLGAIAVGAAPFILGPDDTPAQLARLDHAIGMPLPVALAAFAFCLAIAGFGAGQAALAFARDVPLLPFEQKEHERLLNEVKRLSSQKAIMDRVRGTPMGARPRSLTPAPGQRATPAGPPSRAGSLASMPSYTMPTRAGSMNSVPSYTSPPRTAPVAAPQAQQLPPSRPGTFDSQPFGIPVRQPAPPSSPGAFGGPSRAGSLSSIPSMSTSERSQGTPLGSPPRAGVPVGKLSQVSARSEPQQQPFAHRSAADRTPTLDMDTPFGTPNVPDEPPVLIEDDEEVTHVPPPMPVKPVPSALKQASASQGGGFEQRYATHFPKWGHIDDPWLEDAIQKAEILAEGFPVQAHLYFSAEPNLPFTLVLERATPAMAVRAMVSYVEFLASIAIPPRARILLRSVPHLDRSFHRNVEAALEPYFADKAQVARESDRIDIKFLEWDTQWKDHPLLPIAE